MRHKLKFFAVLLLLIIITLLGVVFKSYIGNTIHKTLDSPEEYYQYIVENNVKVLKKDLFEFKKREESGKNNIKIVGTTAQYIAENMPLKEDAILTFNLKGLINPADVRYEYSVLSNKDNKKIVFDTYAGFESTDKPINGLCAYIDGKEGKMYVSADESGEKYISFDFREEENKENENKSAGISELASVFLKYSDACEKNPKDADLGKYTTVKKGATIVRMQMNASKYVSFLNEFVPLIKENEDFGMYLEAFLGLDAKDILGDDPIEKMLEIEKGLISEPYVFRSTLIVNSKGQITGLLTEIKTEIKKAAAADMAQDRVKYEYEYIKGETEAYIGVYDDKSDLIITIDNGRSDASAYTILGEVLYTKDEYSVKLKFCKDGYMISGFENSRKFVKEKKFEMPDKTNIYDGNDNENLRAFAESLVKAGLFI